MANRLPFLATFDHLLSQLRDGTLPFEVLLDWLEEHEADHASWCLAWRDCPEPADGFQARWAAWLREHEPVRRVTHQTVYRWRQVREVAEDVHLFVQLVWAEANARAATRRDRKRRVLALFPEVEVRIHFTVSWQDWHNDGRRNLVGDERVWQAMHAAGFRQDLPFDRQNDPHDRCYHLTQTVHAPDLIPPEPDALPRQPASV